MRTHFRGDYRTVLVLLLKYLAQITKLRHIVEDTSVIIGLISSVIFLKIRQHPKFIVSILEPLVYQFFQCSNLLNSRREESRTCTRLYTIHIITMIQSTENISYSYFELEEYTFVSPQPIVILIMYLEVEVGIHDKWWTFQ